MLTESAARQTFSHYHIYPPVCLHSTVAETRAETELKQVEILFAHHS